MIQGTQGESFAVSVAFECDAWDYHVKDEAIVSLFWKKMRYK